jgi:CubicO group peptidase (beta-lactamase class C family)
MRARSRSFWLALIVILVGSSRTVLLVHSTAWRCSARGTWRNAGRPTPLAPSDEYGAQVWLKLPNSPGLGEPPMSEDAFYKLGHDGQVVAMVPSRDLVIVRLGLTRAGGDWEPARDLAPLANVFPAHP